MGSSFSPCIFALLLLIFIFVSTMPAHAEATTSNQNLSGSSDFHVLNTREQKFMRGLNLSPRRDANILIVDPLLNKPEIVEKPFRFPSLISDSGSSSSTGFNYKNSGQYAGYYKLNHTYGARMFYYFFESRGNKTEDPVVIWLSGGPGCSSSLALFYENGPFKIRNDLALVWNEYGWDKVANIIYLDQPTGTGFSYSTDKADLRATSEEAGVDFYDFLQAFLGKHPQYVKNDLYITGESYAGHYIPAFAAHVNKENKKMQGIYINLKGIAIGNGWTNSALQTKAYSDYAVKMKLINQTQFNELKEPVLTCLKEVKTACDGTKYNLKACAKTNTNCDVVFDTIVDSNPGLNYYDIRKKCIGSLCYDFSNLERFLDQTKVKKALGVDEHMQFVSCSDAVSDAMSGDEMRNLDIYVPDLLKHGIRLLMYVGEYDLICNWMGNLEWITEMKWWGQKGFSKAPNVTFEVDGVDAGSVKSYGPLTFLTVKDAGHLVPMDQPKASMVMLKRWMQQSNITR